MAPQARRLTTAPRAANVVHTLLRGSLALLLAMLPFELVQGFGLPGGFLTITNIELVVLITLGLWGALLLHERRLPQVPRWLALPLGIFLAALLLSALLAPEQRGGAVKFALRQITGALVALCLAERIRVERERTVRLLLAALLAGGTLSAILGLWEMTESPVAEWVLSFFKTEPSLMSGLLRLSATFTYANTAAMYYEALLPAALLASVFVLQTHRANDTRRPWIRFMPFVLCLVSFLLYLAALLTYSRAALMACVVVLVAAPSAVAWRWHRSRATWMAVGLSAALLALTALLFIFSPTFRLRLFEPEVAAWYSVSYRPTDVGAMAPGEVRQIGVSVSNTGLAAWSHQGQRPFKLSYHWLDADTRRVVRFEGRRTPLPRPVAPGETLEILATVQAPAQPGRYLLAWDLVRENTGGGWLSQMGAPMGTAPVTVAGVPVVSAPAQAAEPPTTPRVIEVQPPPPARRALWSAALQLWMSRPLIGIGPDVFRHIYGPLLGLQTWDQRIHTNNLYLEILVGSGILGFGAFLTLIGVVVWQGLAMCWRWSKQPPPDHHSVIAWPWWAMTASLLGVGTFLAHGLLDVFLAFTPTYMLLWVWIGCVTGLHRIVDKQG